MSERMKEYFTALLIAIITVAAILLTRMHDADASDFHLIEVDTVNIQYLRYADRSREPLLYDSTPKESLNLSVNMDLFKVIGWDSAVVSMTNNGQYAMVGLNTRLYLRVTENLDLGYYHFSKHLLDNKYPYEKFPVLDAFEINLTVYRAHPSGRAGLVETVLGR